MTISVIPVIATGLERERDFLYLAADISSWPYFSVLVNEENMRQTFIHTLQQSGKGKPSATSDLHQLFQSLDHQSEKAVCGLLCVGEFHPGHEPLTPRRWPDSPAMNTQI